ncbi:MAG: radical SAM protein [Candidatus Omnitrophica bacterium]|nr:radical SAM protein [Candidatus Omnitrophota bacterium]
MNSPRCGRGILLSQRMAFPGRMAVRNRYLLLKAKLLAHAIWTGKLSLRKVINVLVCSAAFTLRRTRSGAAPFILSLEVGNECNANCLFCRDAKGRIYDTDPKALPLGGISKGVMPFEMAADLIRQCSKDSLIAVLYTNGEPLLYKDLPRLIQACSRVRLLSMIATNGLLLNEKNITEMLSAGIDFIKVQMSGFTQDVYAVQVRFGNVERLKDNIRLLARKRDEMKCPTVLMLDFIAYSYNSHQLPDVRAFCRELGVSLNIRPGNPRGGLEGREPELSAEALPLPGGCDWPWKGLQVNFNGEVLMCCDGVTFSGSQPYAVFRPGDPVAVIWNGAKARQARATLATQGRGAIPICAQCYRKDLAFKW